MTGKHLKIAAEVPNIVTAGGLYQDNLSINLNTNNI